MKCERVIPALTTGGVFERWRAGQHLKACRQCEAESARLREITRILAEAPPLRRPQRALWMATSIEPRAPRLNSAIPWRFVAGLTVAASLIAILALPRKVEVSPEIVSQSPPVAFSVTNPPSERERLSFEMLAQVDRLESDLIDLRRRADLLDIRHEADLLWSQYSRFDQPPL